jgi:hypothetical protein
VKPKRSSKAFETTTFLNVDLDLASKHDLAPLAKALQGRLLALHVGRIGRTYWARFELRRDPKTPDLAIRRLVAAIEALPAAARALWNRTSRRDFSVGIQAAGMPHASEFVIGSETVAMVSRVGGRIVFTIYGLSLSA